MDYARFRKFRDGARDIFRGEPQVPANSPEETGRDTDVAIPEESAAGNAGRVPPPSRDRSGIRRGLHHSFSTTISNQPPQSATYQEHLGEFADGCKKAADAAPCHVFRHAHVRHGRCSLQTAKRRLDIHSSMRKRVDTDQSVTCFPANRSAGTRSSR